MKNKAIFIVFAVLIVVAGGFLFWQPKSQTPVDTTEQSATDSTNQAATESTADTSPTDTTLATSSNDKTPSTQEQGQYSGEENIQSPDIVVHEIAFDGKAFSPSKLTIKNGDIVIFQNNSDKNFWPASAPHPQHTNYPEFDAKKAIASGGKFEFKFTKSGSWGFHDHITPSAFGSITVE